MRNFELWISINITTFLGIPLIRSIVPPKVPAVLNNPVNIAAPYAFEVAPTS